MMSLRKSNKRKRPLKRSQEREEELLARIREKDERIMALEGMLQQIKNLNFWRKGRKRNDDSWG
jgi:hypothetical protein